MADVLVVEVIVLYKLHGSAHAHPFLGLRVLDGLLDRLALDRVDRDHLCHPHADRVQSRDSERPFLLVFPDLGVLAPFSAGTAGSDRPLLDHVCMAASIAPAARLDEMFNTNVYCLFTRCSMYVYSTHVCLWYVDESMCGQCQVANSP